MYPCALDGSVRQGGKDVCYFIPARKRRAKNWDKIDGPHLNTHKYGRKIRQKCAKSWGEIQGVREKTLRNGKRTNIPELGARRRNFRSFNELYLAFEEITPAHCADALS